MRLLNCKYYDPKYGKYTAIVPAEYIKQVPSLSVKKYTQSKIGRPDLINFWSHIHACLSSGISLLEAVKMFPLQGAKSPLKTLVKSAEIQLELGYQLSQILHIFNKSFDDFSQTVIKTAELNGDYIAAAQAIKQHLQWQQETRGHVSKSLRYPAAVFAILMIVIVILMNFVIPEIARFLKMTNSQSTYYEDIASLSNVILLTIKWVSYILLGSTLVYFSVGLFSNTPKLLKDRFIFKMPIIGEFARTHIYCSYFYVIGQSLSSGANLQDSLNVAEKSIKNTYMFAKAQKFKQLIKNGVSISQAADVLPNAPIILKASLRQAEISGAISDTLKQQAANLSAAYQERISHVASGLGPVMTVVIGCIIIGIVMTVLFPIYDSLGDLNG